MARYFSFLLGMGIAAAILGVFMLALGALKGDGSGEANLGLTAASTPTPEVALTAVLSAAPSATAVPLALTQPEVTTPPVQEEPTAVVSEAPQPAEESTSPAGGSDTPRIQTAQATAIAIQPAQAPAPSQQVLPPPPIATSPPAPAATQPPPAPTTNPVLARLRDVVANLISKTSSLSSRLAAPNFDSTAWSEGTIGLAKEIELLTGVVSVISPPSCAQVAYANLRASTIELSRGTGLIVSGVEARSASLLASGAERLSAGRGGLPVAQASLAPLAC